jgi:hypothetical protein
MDEYARVTGPVAGQPGIIMAGFDLGQVGYTLEEFFLAGTATRFEPAGPVGADGYWEVAPSGQEPFTTRLVVCRPADPDAFTGTVILEWLNVSAGFDAPAHWMLTHRHVVRSGWAWVGISAQRAGIEGGNIFDDAGDEPGPAPRRRMMTLPALKESDPDRYGGLRHPGDAFSFDIFSRGAWAVRSGGILGPLTVECLLAAGVSQSAIHLVSYVNAVAPTLPPEAACDGYLIGCRTGRAAPLEGWDGRIRVDGPDGVRVRTDVAPVLTVQTETDVTGALAGITARQPGSDRFRWWEIAGAAHADTYVIGAAFGDSGLLPPAALARLMAPTAEPMGLQCPAPVNSGPQHHYVAQAAIAHLERWARGGPPPPRSPLLETDPDDHMRLVTDEAGIARGGIRTGWVDVPVARLSGLAPDQAPGIGILFGVTEVFSQAELARRYPGGRDEYAAAFHEATSRGVAEGFLLEQDADEIVALATAAYPA